MGHWIIEKITLLHMVEIHHNIPFEFITKGREIKIPIEKVHIETNDK